MVNIGSYFVIQRHGIISTQYIHFYYYSDALLTICLYFVLMGFYSQVFQEMGVQRYLRMAAVALLGGTAWFSYQVVTGANDRMATRFVVELSQNLYFVGLVLTYLLWGAVMKLRETRTRLIQFVLALGVFFSVSAATYALRNLYPAFLIWRYVPPIIAILFPLAWVYTFMKVPEEARLTPARLMPTNHR